MPIFTNATGWILATTSTAYALGLNDAGALTHRYWGPRLPALADYPPPPSPDGWSSFNPPAQLTPEEYPGYTGNTFVEPCLKVTFADGVRNVVLGYVGATVASEPLPTLAITLEDGFYPLRVTLLYRLYEAYDLLERAVRIENLGTEPILIERIWSALWHLPQYGRYRLRQMVGRHMDEAILRHEPLSEGVKRLESRRLASSHHHSPWFAVDRDPAADLGPGADERAGEVWFGALAWSGNWQIAAEVTDFGSTRIGIGLNDWDFAWRLGPGEAFTTPVSYAGYTAAGFGAMSRCWHTFIRETILPGARQVQKVFYNSWEATHFDVDEASQMQLAAIAASLGVELFVLDDGWFAGRSDDTAALGDWRPDPHKFPHGLTPLIRRVHELGMAFGLWIEPEMVSPKSELYRTHPDWVLHFATRARTESRHQLILNLARPEVQDYLIAQFDRLLTEHPIDFIKWDMNRNISEPGWHDAPGEPREVWVRYIEGLYRVWGALRERHPQIVWQNCSGGGGRVDLGLMRLADQFQLSDNIDPTRFLAMQEGFSQIFPANTMHAWVADLPASHLSLRFRFHVGMCGILGLGGHLVRWTAEERAEAAALIAHYKAIRTIVQFGELYRLRSPQRHAFAAVLYVAPDRSEAVLFAFRTHLPAQTRLPPLRLQGLDPQRSYSIEGQPEVRSGAAWMHLGIDLSLGDFESCVVGIRQV
ncbi:alpha-galactosidase [Candidatus Chloroploca sp. M-50]|uniref:Alpha-galactosidase n=1 Tax=Candidatus Chloroploca mongolica TaxID=2528176 RepID=A0ABS4D4G6_9CHLR|nr:alpha-galactosidase [Candidatus Chloroploca mongolica]MBP1464335.1 alpha-galactosidase [Candidatus Chloroploca mongolica]